MGGTREKLRDRGLETLGVVATNPDRARLYFRYHPPRVPLAADPELNTHRSYGLPNHRPTPKWTQPIQLAYGDLARELRLPAENITETLDRQDGFELTGTDEAERDRHGIQLTGQFLVDREGIVRWANVEFAREGQAGAGKFPSDDELLDAARSL